MCRGGLPGESGRVIIVRATLAIWAMDDTEADEVLRDISRLVLGRGCGIQIVESSREVARKTGQE